MHQHARKTNLQIFSRSLYAVMLSLASCFCSFVCLAQSAKPTITKIDPPNWFTQLPDSLLLVHGEHLEGTTFTLHQTTARIAKTVISPNGHWAFLTLVTAAAQPGTLEIVATNGYGSVTVPYKLSTSRSVADQPKGFSSADVMYLIMPDRFADGDRTNDKLAGFRDPDDRNLSRAYHGGDLRGIQEHLDYLQKLGVTTLWTTPLYDNSAAQSGQSYHGYSATDMYAVDPHFGSMEDYRALVAAAHARGMKVVLDTVPNHVGPAHPWVKDSPTPDWFHGTAASHIKVDDDFASVTDPSASAARRNVLLNGWFADILPDLNQDNPLVAQYLIQNAVWWIESAGLDGLRIDTFPYVPRSFWHDYNEQLHTFYPHLTEVGEIFNKDTHIVSFFAGGRAHAGSDGSYDTLLDTPFDYPMYFALRSALTHHAPMSEITDVLKSDELYSHPERLVTFLGNHDTKRFLSEPGANPAALRLGFGLLATLRGMPQLYYGDELEMEGGDDPDNRKDFPGGFPGDSSNAFTASGRTPEQVAMFDWVSRLMAIRREHTALTCGGQQVLGSNEDWLVFVRDSSRAPGSGCTAATDNQRVVVAVHRSPKPDTLSVDLSRTWASGCRIGRLDVGASSSSAKVTGEQLKLQMGGDGLLIATCH
jgi:neopullulanase